MKTGKTLNSAQKRFKITSSGYFKHKRSNLRHILTKKSTKKKRHLRNKVLVSKNDFKLVTKYFFK